VGGPVLWRTSPEPVPEDEVQGSIDLREVAEIPASAGEVELRVHLSGQNETLLEVSADVLSHQYHGEFESNASSSLGGPPRPETEL
jgi:hypothetical protein